MENSRTISTNSVTDINDDYDHNGKVEYILENALMPDDGSPEFQQLKDDYNSQLSLSCRCTNQQRSCCANKDICCHGGCFRYHREDGELVLIREEINQVPAIIECNDLCECQLTQCLNRHVQYGPRKKLEIFYSPQYKSKGLRTSVNIPCGAFICEYAGELLTITEAKRRQELIDKQNLMNYILCLREHAYSSNENTLQITIIDPTRRGNIGRYLNHSCDPNCEIFAVRINCPIPKIGIFAKRDICANEELCFHYGGEHFKEEFVDGKPCLCYALNCVGVIPNTRM